LGHEVLAAAGQLFEKESQRAQLSFDTSSFASAITELRRQVEKAAASP
jgi:hypothetical protein